MLKQFCTIGIIIVLIYNTNCKVLVPQCTIPNCPHEYVLVLNVSHTPCPYCVPKSEAATMTTMVPPRPGPDSKCDSIVCYPGYELITEGSPDGCPYCQMIAVPVLDINCTTTASPLTTTPTRNGENQTTPSIPQTTSALLDKLRPVSINKETTKSETKTTTTPSNIVTTRQTKNVIKEFLHDVKTNSSVNVTRNVTNKEALPPTTTITTRVPKSKTTITSTDILKGKPEIKATASVLVKPSTNGTTNLIPTNNNSNVTLKTNSTDVPKKPDSKESKIDKEKSEENKDNPSDDNPTDDENESDE